jgi:hypothetical protein
MLDMEVASSNGAWGVDGVCEGVLLRMEGTRVSIQLPPPQKEKRNFRARKKSFLLGEGCPPPQKEKRNFLEGPRPKKVTKKL